MSLHLQTMASVVPKAFALALVISSFGSVFSAEPAEPTHTISTKQYTIEIRTPAFRFEVRDSDRVVFPADTTYGLSFCGSPVASCQRLSQEEGISRFRMTNGTGKTALVEIKTHDHVIEIYVNLGTNLSGNEIKDIRLRVGAPGPAFGLGDPGSFGKSANLAIKQRAYPMAHDGGQRRWISSFLVFPQAGGAGVAFDHGGGSVDIGPDYYEMANVGTDSQTFYYFVGSMPDIYAAYRKIRIENGYPGVPPKPAGFELGWESWDALRWNTNAVSVQQSIGRFLNAGYPIHWAVTGSGFWCEQGSTLHFGSFNDQKYPDEDGDGVVDLKTWLQAKQIKWLLGQRINFVPPGGPYSSKPGESGATLFATSPDTQAGLDGDFFLTSDDGRPVMIKSRIFPTVPCYLADGNRPGAARWFEQHYRAWGVDGVKEDTMMSVPDHTIFNATMRQLAAGGALVMARCGAYSAPGTLMRINDTHGPSSMSLRAPINYLQYAACAAPNVYSDTVGFGHLHDVRATLRHAWFTSLTAGMAVGSGPWKWSAKDQALLKKAIDFHYAITPYLYTAAVESHRTGYPHTMTPLPIAFPDDENTYDLASSGRQQFQWMAGPSLLATPLLHRDFHAKNKADIYLPKGEWIDFSTGERFNGPITMPDYPMPLDRPPCFVGGKGILVLREKNRDTFQAMVFPNAPTGTTYDFYCPSATSRSHIAVEYLEWNARSMHVVNRTTGAELTFEIDDVHGAIVFDLLPGGDYQVTDIINSK